MIHHVVILSEWEEQRGKQVYFPTSFDKEGFIHCCTPRQLTGVLTRYFKGTTGIGLLYLDETKLLAELKYEIGTDGEHFPHLFGGINADAVIKLEMLQAIR